MTRRVLAAFFLVLLAAGCGASAAEKRRHAVNDYLDQVNHAEATLAARSGAVDSALRAFNPGGTTPDELKGLVRARTTLEEALRNVRALDPPRDAAKLHADVVRLLALQASTADELVRTARFVPRLAATVQPVQAAAAQLAADLAAIKPGSTGAVVLRRYAAAFARYRTSLQPTAAKLAALSAPPTFAPELLAERHAVSRSIQLGGTIEKALLRHDIAGANAGIRALYGIVTELKSVKTQRAQAAAVRAYDARIARVAELAAAVAAERQRLVQSVG